MSEPRFVVSHRGVDIFVTEGGIFRATVGSRCKVADGETLAKVKQTIDAETLAKVKQTIDALIEEAAGEQRKVNTAPRRFARQPKPKG